MGAESQAGALLNCATLEFHLTQDPELEIVVEFYLARNADLETRNY